MTSPDLPPPAHGAAPHRILVAGMSHVAALERGWDILAASFPMVEAEFLDLRSWPEPADAFEGFGHHARSVDGIVLLLRGNEHVVVGLANASALADARGRLEHDVRRGMEIWLDGLLPHAKAPLVLLLPPPPIEDIAPVLARKQALRTDAQKLAMGQARTLLETHGLRPARERLALWQHQCRLLAGIASDRKLELPALPDAVFSASGMLAPACCGETDLTHGNALYGSLVLERALASLRTHGRHAPSQAGEGRHPYQGLPAHAYWKQAMEVEPASLNPVVRPKFTIGAGDRIATAGSCFAGHLATRLRQHGLDFMDVEPSAPGLHAFSAQYGNIYTSRQLLQLFQRAFGTFAPVESAWRRPDGRYCDPFRPRITEEGHPDPASVAEAIRSHLAAVRRMFQELEVFVFTLGLTECWSCREDGAVYPLAPGVFAGEYDPGRHAFLNLDHAAVKDDMAMFLQSLREVNPGARVVLTVSPVPMVATGEARHVLVSNAESKAVLRSVAGELCRSDRRVEYFPSYELITGPHSRGAYFAADSRTVTDEGVDHAMRAFRESFLSAAGPNGHDAAASGAESAYDILEAATAALCDEELYAMRERKTAK